MDPDFTEGMQFDKGYLSPYFVTDAGASGSDPRRPLHPVHERQDRVVQDPLPVLEKVMQSGGSPSSSPEDVEGEALATLVVSKIRGTLHAAPSRPRLATAARPCCRTWRCSPAARSSPRDPGLKLENTVLDLTRPGPDRGRRDTTTIVEVPGPGGRRGGRIARSVVRSTTPTDWDREKLQERLAKLAGGVAVVRSAPPPRWSSRRRSTASRTPVSHPCGHRGGCGRRRRHRPHPHDGRGRGHQGWKDDEATGAKMVLTSPRRPARLIADSAGREGAVVVRQVESETGSMGLRRHRRVRGPHR